MTIATPYTNFNHYLNGGFSDTGIFIFPCRAGNGQSEFLLHTSVYASHNNKKVAHITFENEIQNVLEHLVSLYSMDFLTKLSDKKNFTVISVNSNSKTSFIKTLMELTSNGFNCFVLDGFDAFFTPNEIVSFFDELRSLNPDFFVLLGYHFNLQDNYYRTIDKFEVSDLNIDKNFIDKYLTFSIFSNRLELIENGTLKKDEENVQNFFRFYKSDSFRDSNLMQKKKAIF